MLRKLISVLLLVACAVALADARVVRVEVTSRNDVFSGKPFGDAGSYERIVGRVYYDKMGHSPCRLRSGRQTFKKDDAVFGSDLQRIETMRNNNAIETG